MYLVSEEFSEQIKSDNREFSVALTFNSSTTLTGTTIQNISVDEIVNSTDILTLGCACSHKATINLIKAPRGIDYMSSSFVAEVRLKNIKEAVPLGKFYITEVKTANDYKNMTITAYDGFCKMSGAYISEIEGETTLQAIYDDLKDKLAEECGIVLKARILPEHTLSFKNIANTTYQQAIGYIAGCLGGFARFDRSGELEIAKYTDTNIIISRSEQFMGGFKKLTDSPLSITSVATGTKENVIVCGDGAAGVGINFENPYINEAMAEDIYADFNNFTYTPCQLKWRGNPAIQAGDIVHAIDSDGNSHNVLVMSQNIKIGGGLGHTIDCKGKSENVSKFSNGFETSNQKLDRIYTELEAQIIKATESITGNSGGHVIWNDSNNDGIYDEILIMDEPHKEDAENVWRWNQEGLGHSNSGYSGPYTTAITAEGAISADFITTGTMSAERIAVETYDDETKLLQNYIRFSNGTIEIGEEGNALTLKLENDQIAFYRGAEKIAYFSNNSFEVENLTDGKIRFANFGYIPRASGNLTFTKLT